MCVCIFEHTRDTLERVLSSMKTNKARAKSERSQSRRARLVGSLLAHARSVRLRAYSSRAPSDRRRQAHPCLGPSTPSPLAASEPAHASSASPSPPLVYPERARTARTLALLADCAHACDPRADANDSRNRSYYERHDGTMHEHVQRTTHRRSTLGAGTLSR